MKHCTFDELVGFIQNNFRSIQVPDGSINPFWWPVSEKECVETAVKKAVDFLDRHPTMNTAMIFVSDSSGFEARRNPSVREAIFLSTFRNKADALVFEVEGSKIEPLIVMD